MHYFQVGDLLVASSLVDGTILNQSVCLLVYEDEHNVIGLMLNRPMRAVVASELEGAGGSKHPPRADLSAGPGAAGGPAPSPTASGRIPGLGSGSPADELEGMSATEKAAAHSPADPFDAGGPQPPAEVIAVIGKDQDPFAGKLIKGSALHFGGPLAGPVVAVHGTAELGEAEAGEGVFVAAQRDHLEALLQNEQQPYRLIVGHLGWSHEQLANEINEGIWHAIPATAEVLSTEDAMLWPRLIRRATANSVARWIGVPDAAEAAELN